MISYKDIKKSINTLLKDEFKVEINSNDVSEGFLRPSFFVRIDNPTHSATVAHVDKLMTIRIYYFPSDPHDYSLELLDIGERLEKLFSLKLPVLDRKFNIHDSTSTLTDGVLQYSFDLEFSDVRTILEYTDTKHINENGEYIDENGDLVLDGDGNPVTVEKMKTFDLKGV